MIQLNNWSITYPDGMKAVSEVSFTMNQGERVGLIGANGAGKSTLLMSLVGAVETVSGEAEIAGLPFGKASLADIRKLVGFVFQNPDDQLFSATIYDDLAFAPRNYRLPPDEAGKRVEQVLDLLHIDHLRDRPPFRLSGGEKRLCALGSVLTMRPELLLLDEPTSFLDPKARRLLIGILSALSNTMLIATHDLDMAWDLCGRVIVLSHGRIAADGAARDILRDEQLLNDCGLERPLSLMNRE